MTRSQHLIDALVVWALVTSVLAYAIPKTDWIIIGAMAIIATTQALTLYLRLETIKHEERIAAWRPTR